MQGGGPDSLIPPDPVAAGLAGGCVTVLGRIRLRQPFARLRSRLSNPCGIRAPFTEPLAVRERFSLRLIEFPQNGHTTLAGLRAVGMFRLQYNSFAKEGSSMKSFVLGVVMACPFLTFLPQAICQDKKPAEQKLHLLATGGERGATLAAFSIERGATYPSVIRLRGDVEIKRSGMVMYADEADYHEDTGEIEARGNVRVKPYPPRTK